MDEVSSVHVLFLVLRENKGRPKDCSPWFF